MKPLLLFVALTVSAPVHAQQVTYSDAATQTCLAKLGAQDDAMQCAGLSAENCMNVSSGGFSTAGMTTCLDREISFWDGLLNANYRAAMELARSTDADAEGTNAPSQEHALREMQRAWIPFRDASCEYARSQWGGGTGGGPAALACYLDQTARQAVLLGQRLGD